MWKFSPSDYIIASTETRFSTSCLRHDMKFKRWSSSCWIFSVRRSYWTYRWMIDDNEIDGSGKSGDNNSSLARKKNIFFFSLGSFIVDEKQISNYNHNQTCLFLKEMKSEFVVLWKLKKKVKMYFHERGKWGEWSLNETSLHSSIAGKFENFCSLRSENQQMKAILMFASRRKSFLWLNTIKFCDL